jgi:hypothetical protein
MRPTAAGVPGLDLGFQMGDRLTTFERTAGTPIHLPVATYGRADGPSVATIPAVMGDGLKPLTTR